MGRLLVSSMLLCLLACLVSSMNLDRAMLRTYFGCPPCDESACPMPKGCIGEIVKEPGYCGCCFTCARVEGEPCGVFTEKCAKGLKCIPLSENHVDGSAWETLFKGQGICSRV